MSFFKLTDRVDVIDDEWTTMSELQHESSKRPSTSGPNNDIIFSAFPNRLNNRFYCRTTECNFEPSIDEMVGDSLTTNTDIVGFVGSKPEDLPPIAHVLPP